MKLKLVSIFASVATSLSLVTFIPSSVACAQEYDPDEVISYLNGDVHGDAFVGVSDTVMISKFISGVRDADYATFTRMDAG